jgi:hypothetical protein
MSGDGLSTPDKAEAHKNIKINSALEIIRVDKLTTITPKSIFEYYFNDEAPTILNIDIEGKDKEVLESIDFNKYRPLIIITEMIKYNTKLNFQTKNAAIVEFLNSKGYMEYAFTGINSIFIDKYKLAY